ncbi:hypothetical protein ACMA1D_02165 [Streptomyces sp. 796.1]|uniref:hypothetical protein n=1 Tax=Streptomyces sp. 796.1 TaxID=3163029 RepID=UPI0039C90B37
MTGPEHYRQAEWLLDRAHYFTYGDGLDVAQGHALAAEAQAHATLALAAATAMHADIAASAADIRDARLDEWIKATSSTTCAECDHPVPAGSAYCSALCRNAADDHGADEPAGGDE